MKIKKISEETTSSRITKIVTFRVNGKVVRVQDFQMSDSETGDYDSERDINNTDMKSLTEEEHEAIGENMDDAFELSDGEEMEVE